MLSALRTFATLTVLLVLLVIAGVWGWHNATKPFPHRAHAQACAATVVHKGQRISPVDVTVSVLNASNRDGLADRTLNDLEKHHFGAGNTGNAPRHAKVTNAQIWTEDPHNPAVRLVASWLPHATVVKRNSGATGITVVVGEGFTKVRGGKSSLRVNHDATICGPVID